MRWARVQRWMSPGVAPTHDPDARLCARCGYPFPGGRDGAPGPCTECGTHIDPSRLADLRPEGPPDAVLRLLRAPGAGHLVVIVVGACVLAAGGIVPAGYWRIEVTGVLVLLVAWGLWLLRGAIALAAAAKLGRIRDTVRQRGWWVNAAAGIALPVIATSNLPMRATFLVERRRLDAAAAAWTTQPDRAIDVDFVLLAGASRPDTSLADALGERIRIPEQPGWNAGGFGIALPGSGFIFETGVYYYLPNAPPAAVPPGLLRHLGGPWFAGHHTW